MHRAYVISGCILFWLAVHEMNFVKTGVVSNVLYEVKIMETWKEALVFMKKEPRWGHKVHIFFLPFSQHRHYYHVHAMQEFQVNFLALMPHPFL